MIIPLDSRDSTKLKRYQHALEAQFRIYDRGAAFVGRYSGVGGREAAYRFLAHGLTFGWFRSLGRGIEIISVMNEWDLQAELTDRWLKESLEMSPLGRLDLVAWELMFPSWEIADASFGRMIKT